jgi:hypothetical protein
MEAFGLHSPYRFLPIIRHYLRMVNQFRGQGVLGAKSLQRGPGLVQGAVYRIRLTEIQLHLWLSLSQCSKTNIRKTSHEAPNPFRTAGIVLSNILISSHRDQLSIYPMSSSIHFSKLRLLRPFTCQRQVMPGRMLKRRRCQS